MIGRHELTYKDSLSRRPHSCDVFIFHSIYIFAFILKPIIIQLSDLFPGVLFYFPVKYWEGFSRQLNIFYKTTLRFLRYLASQYDYVTTFLLDKMKSINYIPLLKTISPTEEKYVCWRSKMIPRVSPNCFSPTSLIISVCNKPYGVNCRSEVAQSNTSKHFLQTFFFKDFIYQRIWKFSN